MSSDVQPGRAQGRIWFAIIPLALFLVLSGVFLVQLLSGRDVAAVPSALIGAQAPSTDLPPLEGMGLAGLDDSDFEGKMTLVNVWASWCAPCRQEHPYLMELADDPRIDIAGLNYKDRPENARSFLSELGNPYSAIGVDNTGRTAIDWGVYGVPETFLLDASGTIIYKHVGPFTQASYREELLPAIERAHAGQLP